MASGKELYDEKWDLWAEMKVYGPVSRWPQHLFKKPVGCGEGTNTAHLADQISTFDFDNAGSSNFIRGKYGVWQKLAVNLPYFFLRVSARKNLGDQIVGLFEKK